ncbi:S1C family serine protease [Microlunatus flavus]|uniref:Putative serine protease PepD n=1 Tax=Microlunatus flavus TaxID=1036181 RepID=A0A1H8ZNQ0_9ACTN|nr:trypsin-like peptidase domain-containing protein [Microlunatus flavus]SEP65964.1 putative serine protease PepD [Microlunatus flavus]
MTSDEQRGSDTPGPSSGYGGYGQGPSADDRAYPRFSAPGQPSDQGATDPSGYPPPSGAAWGSSAYAGAQQGQGQGYGGAGYGGYGTGSYGSGQYGQAYGATPAQPAPTGTAVLGRPRKRRGGVLAAAALSAVIGAGAGIGSYAYVGGTGSATSPISVTTVPAANTPVLDGTVSAAAAKIDPSVVTITVQAGNSGDIGSGVVLDTDGHILTNDHVVSAASGSSRSSVTVTLPDGRTAPARVIGTSASNDLAVIKVDGVADLKPATFAKSGSIKVGQAVVAFGAPLGLSESVTSGIVSNTARPVRSGDDNDAVYLAVQTDAAINPGNSGGPLVDLNGSVVGINSSIASTGSSQGGGQSGNIGIGFAIPSDVAVRVASELIADGKSVNAALGVSVGGADNGLSTATGVPLQTVNASGAAAAAGLRVGDVVTKVDDFPTTTPDGLIAATRYYAPGTKITVTYTRDGGAPQTADVTLGRA